MIRKLGIAGLAALLIAAGCDDPVHPGPFHLTIRGGAGLVAAHAGRPVALAVVELATDSVVARAATTVATSGETAFEVLLPYPLGGGNAHELLTWIDANQGGGAPGSCDAPTVDPQWRTPLTAPANGTVVVEGVASEIGPSCDGFTVDFTFGVSAAVRTEYGGHDLVVRVVDAATDAVRMQWLTQVPEPDDSPFALVAEGLLVVGRSYDLVIWFDANQGGGAPGVCDPTAHDPQWRLTLGVTGEGEVQRTLEGDEAMIGVCPIHV